MVQHGMGSQGGADGGAEDGRPGTGERESRQPVRLVAGRQRLTLNPVDGSEVVLCPDSERPRVPRRLTRREREINARHASGGTTAAASEGTGLTAAERTSGTGPGAPGRRAIPMLERDAERRRLVGRLRQGRSVRITGLPGSGRTTLVDAVASDVADLAPDGVVRLSGRRRTAADLQQELFTAVHDAPRYRPDDEIMREALGRIGAVVVVDDLAFGGEALGRLLDATPECAYLLTATPEVEPPSGDVQVEEFRINGLSRNACLELLEHAVRRPLTDEEADAAQDMWAASEEPSGGLPLRFVQAGALLRYGGRTGEMDGRRGSAMSARVAERTSAPARDALRFALALGGELPHPAQLPALVGDRDAQAAAGELARAGLVVAAGGPGCLHLAEGVAEALTEAGFADGTGGRALMAAHHYGWWAGHPSVPAERVAAEAEAVLAAVQGAHAAGHASAAVLLARAAAPALGAGTWWGAWDRVLRAGLEAARTSGDVAQEAYFHHELGVLALCTGQLQRAAAELEASIALRGALQDQQGMLTGRRVLTLATDLLVGRDPDARPKPPAASAASAGAAPDGPDGASSSSGAAASSPSSPSSSSDPSSSSSSSSPAPTLPLAAVQSLAGADLESTLAASLRGHRRGEVRDGEGESARTVAATIRSPRRTGARPGQLTPQLVHPERTSVAYGVRRNLAAAGAGAVLIAVLATIVGLGRAPDEGPVPLDRGTPGTSSQRDEHSEVNAEDPERSRTPRTVESSSDSPSPSSDSPSASESVSERPRPSSSVPKPPDPSDSEPGGSGGTGSPTDPPTSNGGTDSGGSDSGGTDSGGTDGGSDSGGTDSGGTDSGGTDSGGTDGGTDSGGTDSGGTDSGGTDTGGTTSGGSDTGGTTDGGGSDSGGTDTGGTDTGGTGGTILGDRALSRSARP